MKRRIQFRYLNPQKIFKPLFEWLFYKMLHNKNSIFLYQNVVCILGILSVANPNTSLIIYIRDLLLVFRYEYSKIKLTGWFQP